MKVSYFPVAITFRISVCLRYFSLLCASLLFSACATTASETSAGVTEPPEPGPQLSEQLLFDLLRGEFAGNSGDLDGSVKYYMQAAENTEDSRVAARATYISLYANKYDQALQALQRWQQLAPEAEEIDKVYAITHLKRGDSEKTAEYLHRQLSKADTGDERDKALAVKNLLQKEAESVELSRAVLSSLSLLMPGNMHLYLLEARYAAQLEDYDGALQLLDKVLSIDPVMPDVYMIKSRILAAQGKRKESMQIIKGVLDGQPDNHGLRLSYARMLVDDRQFMQAKQQFLILLDQDENNADTLLSLALLSIETEQLEDSQVYLEKLIDLDQKTDVANYYLGRIAQNNKNPKVAIAYYLKVQNSDYVFDAKLRIAGLFAKLGRAEEGLRQLEKLADNQENWSFRVRIYLAQGEILRELGRYEDAVEMYSRALMQNPDDPDLLYARALAAEKMDRLDITEADLLRVISSEPDNANALNALGYTLADRTERLQEAQNYIKRAAELVPDDPAILDSLGWVSYRLGEMQEALNYLRMAFEKLEDAEIAAHYGEVLWMNQQQDEARRVWKIGSDADAKHPVLLDTLKRFKQ